jgi:hypothetical protein
VPASILLDNWNTYQTAWADIASSRRQELIRSSVAEECVYTDPTSVSHGHLELTAKMQATQRNYPGASFRNDRFVEHHREAISQWTMTDGNGQPIFVGQSFACFDGDGRLTKMTGFFEPAT